MRPHPKYSRGNCVSISIVILIVNAHCLIAPLAQISPTQKMWTQEALAKLSYRQVQEIAKVCFSCLLCRRANASPAGFQGFGKPKKGCGDSRYPGVCLPLYPFYGSVLVVHLMTLLHSCSRHQKYLAPAAQGEAGWLLAVRPSSHP